MDYQLARFNLESVKREWEMSVAHCSTKFERIRPFWCRQKSDYKVVAIPEFPCAQVAPPMGRATADSHSTKFSDEALGEVQ